ncbi:HelD family protein [Brevibacillus daliensis]|uniref:HelD family protein n=1 Tax=Brevibacillus daliensis TaxID=2892995 RepID=UPI001E50E0DC|nr:3'-5' exonuclease [Brevibacillus daliensis]
MTIRHPAYEEEQLHLDKTVRIIHKEMEQLRDDLREATDDYIKQVVNSSKAKDLFYLENSYEKPYFGRVDFMKDETYELDSVYIGKRGIVERDTIESIVVDWRAPIASLYYSGESKEAFYRTPKGLVRGEVQLKRNFAIEKGNITGIYDGALKETISREIGSPDDFLEEGYIDEFLASSLNESNDSRLKDIVATIQSEQNDIIRAEKDRAIVVQGVAGSGKTTIALHRLSYLIYNYQHIIASRKFMVFAPNKLFLTYISDVLPELGVEDVQQATFAEWAAKQIKPDLPKGTKIVDPSKALLLFFENQESKQAVQKNTWNRMSFKGSLSFMQILSAYLTFFVEEMITYKDLRFIHSRTKHVFEMKKTEVKRLFTEELVHLPYHRRLEALKKHLKQQLTQELYSHLRQSKIDLDKHSLIRFEAKMEEMIEMYVSKWPPMQLFPVYKELLTTPDLLRKLAPPDVMDEVLTDVVTTSKSLFEEQRVEVEDLAALIYLRHLIEGSGKEPPFDHTVIDEAQDLSFLEIAVLSLFTKNESMTIVGDLAQGIHAYRGLDSWQPLLTSIFKRKTDFYTLEQSYRSTVEIMNWSNLVLAKADIPEVTIAKPVLRHGDEPTIARMASHQELLADIQKRIKLEQEKGHNSIAVVTKTVLASKKLAKELRDKGVTLTLLGVKDKEFPDGVTVMPAFLTKGLQFDVVIVLDVDGEHYQETVMDAKLLYVIMTRPVHQLFLYLEGEASVTPWLKEIEDQIK